MRHAIGVSLLVALAALFGASRAASLSALTTFDQIEQVNDLGGTVFELPGAVNQMLDATDFVGPATNLTGVQVTLPGYVFATSFDNFDDGGSTEPGNFASVALGSPTDVTYTRPGSGGPDGTNGDGSLQILAGSGAGVDLLFGVDLIGGTGDADLFIFTDTAGGGTADVTLLLDGSEVLGQSVNTLFPMGSVAVGVGGVLLDVPTGVSFDGIRIDGVDGRIEVDAVAAVPEPAPALLLGIGLTGLGFAGRRR